MIETSLAEAQSSLEKVSRALLRELLTQVSFIESDVGDIEWHRTLKVDGHLYLPDLAAAVLATAGEVREVVENYRLEEWGNVSAFLDGLDIPRSTKTGEVYSLVGRVGLLRARTATEATRPLNEWQPIETAPKDGKTIIVPGGIAHWYNGCWRSLTGLEWPGRPIDWHSGSKWMPFPKTP